MFVLFLLAAIVIILIWLDRLGHVDLPFGEYDNLEAPLERTIG